MLFVHAMNATHTTDEIKEINQKIKHTTSQIKLCQKTLKDLKENDNEELRITQKHRELLDQDSRTTRSELVKRFNKLVKEKKALKSAIQ
jgi:predicted AAA+ superfamily ATPase